MFFEGYDINKTAKSLENKNKSEISSKDNCFLWKLKRWYNICKNKTKHSMNLPDPIIENIKLFYSSFFPNIRMLFVIGAISHTGCNETEKAAYGTTEVKFAVCSVRNDCRENDFNLL